MHTKNRQILIELLFFFEKMVTKNLIITRNYFILI